MDDGACFLPSHHRLFRRRCIEWTDTLNEFAQPAYTWTCPSGRSCRTLGHFLYVSSSDRSQCSGSTCAKRGGAGLIFVCAGEMLWIHWACMSRRHHVKGWAKWNSWCSINVQTDSVWRKIGTFAWWNKLFRCFAQQLWKDWVFCIPNHSYIVLDNSCCGCMLPKSSEPWSRGWTTKKLQYLT